MNSTIPVTAASIAPIAIPALAPVLSSCWACEVTVDGAGSPIAVCWVGSDGFPTLASSELVVVVSEVENGDALVRDCILLAGEVDPLVDGA